MALVCKDPCVVLCHITVVLAEIGHIPSTHHTYIHPSTYTHAHSGLVSSGSPGPPEVRLYCDEGGLKNPMDWGAMPTSLKQKFPHWKENLSEKKPRSQSSLTTGEACKECEGV